MFWVLKEKGTPRVFLYKSIIPCSNQNILFCFFNRYHTKPLNHKELQGMQELGTETEQKETGVIKRTVYSD